MTALKHPLQDKLLCYPMAGPILEQFKNLISLLRDLECETDAQTDFVNWIERKFSLSHSFAAKVCAVLFRGTGLVSRPRRIFGVTAGGLELLRNPDERRFYAVLCNNFAGVAVLPELVVAHQPIPWDVLHTTWNDHMRQRYPTARSWSKQHCASQLRFRVDWLRAIGFVSFVSGKYLLSQTALRELRLRREANARSDSERRIVSHNDLEDKLTAIGAFFQFEVKKRASIRDILPQTNRALKQDRQVDCLWVRFVPFGGTLQYPFEVQLSGSMADAIERLEMVSSVVQKAVVVTDADQQEQMLNRLTVKRSSLLDKLVFVTPDDVDKVVEAATIMRSFSEHLFGHVGSE